MRAYAFVCFAYAYLAAAAELTKRTNGLTATYLYLKIPLYAYSNNYKYCLPFLPLPTRLSQPST